MTAQQKWTEARAGENLCHDGQAFARKHRLLSTAWRSCKNGCFMAYWLLTHASKWHENHHQLMKLRPRRFGLLTGYNLNEGESDATPKELAQFATAIRGKFNSDGSQRKRTRA